MPCHDTYYYGNIPFLQKDQFFLKDIFKEIIYLSKINDTH